jgi:conjugal transfer pilus assembly protein TraU
VLLRKSCSILLAVIVAMQIALPTTAPAEETPTPEPVIKCEDMFPNLVADINWGAMFPLRIGGKTVLDLGDMPDNVDTGNADDFNPEDLFCMCPDHNDDGIPEGGIYVSFWEPARVIEVNANPGCFSFLFGMDMHEAFDGFGSIGGRGGRPTDRGDKAFYNANYYAFPLLAVMEIIKDMVFCHDFFNDVEMISSTIFNPQWQSDELSVWMNPEAAVFANPLAQAACAADCIAASAGYSMNSMFWCAGCWGSMYPYTGNTSLTASPVRTTSLITSRYLARMARFPMPPEMELDTSGPGAKCGELENMIRPLLKKSQYRMCMLKPVPESETCHTLGASTMTWGEHRNIPGIGETHIYMIWRKRNCCLKFMP